LKPAGATIAVFRADTAARRDFRGCAVDSNQVHLPRRTKQVPEALLGKRAFISAPTVRASLTGTVVDVDKYTVSIEVSSDLLVAVDFEDCKILG
jgi:hypothetical protein